MKAEGVCVVVALVMMMGSVLQHARKFALTADQIKKITFLFVEVVLLAHR